VIAADRYPDTARLAQAVTATWPEHARFIEQSFSTRDEALLASTEVHADMVTKIIGSGDSLDVFAKDYRFLCEEILKEELYFRRNGAYRLSTFDDAFREVYANNDYMRRYYNFMLLSHVLWDNHARAIAHFESKYLPELPDGTQHLEVGPGHGLLLHLASAATTVAGVTGWDVSQASIARTRDCLLALGGKTDVDLVLQDLFDAPPPGEVSRRFGSVVMAEVLEHLEDPVAALRAVARHMTPAGRLWIHVPINSPAPDHIYLLRSPEEAIDLVREAGFEPLDAAFYPMTGQTLERARKRDLTISAVVAAPLRS
jgi:2-polyprenyl-3-methyl-5-hydroxy-6-metoxy-1,4-benzoquinol methylase